MTETRKVQGIGKTLYVSLPKLWTRKIQLKKGDPISLILLPDDSICIYPAAKSEKRREISLSINAKASMQSLKREIVAAYVDGFDTIKLKTEEKITEKQQEAIREIVDHLFGLEIIGMSRDCIIVECLLKRSLSIDMTIQRIHNVISSMFGETISVLREKNANTPLGLLGRIHDVRRLSLVTNRLLRSLLLFPTPENKMKMSFIDCVDYLQMLHIISEIACDVNKISESVMVLNNCELPKHIVEDLYQVSATIKQSFDNSIRAILSKNMNLANQLLDVMAKNKLNLEKTWRFCIEENKTETSSLVLSHVYLLIDCLKRIHQHSTNIAEIAIDRAEATIASN